MEEYARRKYGFISYNIPPEYQSIDFSCLAYSLVLAIAYVEGDKRKLKSYKRYFSKLREAGLNLCRLAGVDLNANGGGGLEEIDIFQNHLKTKYKICVYEDRYGSDVLYEKFIDPNLKTLNLLLSNNHFYAITNCTAAFTTSYYCESCHNSYSNRFRHRCPYKCPLCFGETKCNTVPNNERIKCPECNRRFNGITCYTNHLSTVCHEFTACDKSDRLYARKNKHECNSHYCRVCLGTKPLVHDCYMPLYKTKCDYNNPAYDAEESDSDERVDPYASDFDPSEVFNDEKPNFRPPLFILFDLETTQDTKLPDSDSDSDSYEHCPNLCVANNACKWCIDTPENINVP